MGKKRNDEEEEEEAQMSDTNSDSSFDLTCPLELLLDPTYQNQQEKKGVDESDMLDTISELSAQGLAKTAERCTCPKGVVCKFRKVCDSDRAWWPHCAKAWFEADAIPEFRQPPKDKKTWKQAYLALKPEEGPTPMELEERRLKQEKNEKRAEKWALENKVGKSAIKGRAKGSGEELGIERKGADKSVLREFYKTVKAKPKGRGHRDGVVAFDAGALV